MTLTSLELPVRKDLGDCACLENTRQQSARRESSCVQSVRSERRCRKAFRATPALQQNFCGRVRSTLSSMEDDPEKAFMGNCSPSREAHCKRRPLNKAHTANHNEQEDIICSRLLRGQGNGVVCNLACGLRFDGKAGDS